MSSRFRKLQRQLAPTPAAMSEAEFNARFHQVVERLVAVQRIVEVGLVASRGRDPFRRARFVVEQARAFEADGLGCLTARSHARSSARFRARRRR